jgi:hypothetical protein
VASTGPKQPAALSRSGRLTAIILAAGLSALLLLAAVLRPDPRHYGTHQQLGLPPCSFTVLFGKRCPTCGMTTAWSHLVRGQPIGALRASVSGSLLGALALLAVPWLVISAIRGRWLGWAPEAVAAARVALAVAAITLVEWGVRLLAGY